MDYGTVEEQDSTNSAAKMEFKELTGRPPICIAIAGTFAESRTNTPMKTSFLNSDQIISSVIHTVLNIHSVSSIPVQIPRLVPSQNQERIPAKTPTQHFTSQLRIPFAERASTTTTTTTINGHQQPNFNKQSRTLCPGQRKLLPPYHTFPSS